MTTNPFLQPSQATAPGEIVNGRYHLPHPETGKPHTWMRTTNFIEKIADGFALKKWEEQVILAGLALREDLYFATCAATEFIPGTMDLTKESKAELNKVIEEAKEAGGGNVGARLGTAFHTLTERAKRGEPIQVPKKWEGKVELYLKTLADHQLTPNLHLLERKVVNLTYNCAGTFDDAFTTIDLGLVVGDTKTQKEIHSYCSPAMQFAMYAYADAVWNAVTGTYDPMPDFNKELALLVHIPVRGEKDGTGVVEEVDIAAGWKALKTCHDAYEFQKAGRRKGELGRLYRPNPIRITETYARRLKDAGSVDDLIAIYQEASDKGAWCPELEEVGLLRRSELVEKDLVSTVDTVSTVN